ncbi:hypothetical protein PAMP_021514 [Pampus punctatissimus]
MMNWSLVAFLFYFLTFTETGGKNMAAVYAVIFIIVFCILGLICGNTGRFKRRREPDNDRPRSHGND